MTVENLSCSELDKCLLGPIGSISWYTWILWDTLGTQGALLTVYLLLKALGTCSWLLHFKAVASYTDQSLVMRTPGFVEAGACSACWGFPAGQLRSRLPWGKVELLLGCSLAWILSSLFLMWITFHNLTHCMFCLTPFFCCSAFGFCYYYFVILFLFFILLLLGFLFFFVFLSRQSFKWQRPGWPWTCCVALASL